MSTTGQTTWLTVSQIAREMGLSRHVAYKHLRKAAWAYPPTYRIPHTVWDARVLDLLRAMRGQEHRTLEPAHDDWLARYLKEQLDARTAP